jgi:hypothetical protein
MKTIFFCLTLLFLTSCSKYATYFCPPKSEPVNVLKNPMKAYPVYAKTYQTRYNATVKVFEKVEVGISGDIATQVVQLREQLDQESSRIQMYLQTSVIGLHTTPCDTLVRNRFWKFIDKVNTNANKLSELSMRLEVLKQPIVKNADGSITIPGYVKIDSLRSFLKGDYKFIEDVK